MSHRTKILIKSFWLAAGLFLQHIAFAQVDPPYANSWINYAKPYVKIGITQKGLHRIPFSSLPKDFPVGSPEKLQLWRRGKQVSIISSANNEILFYALPNDGASDSLLYRPMNSRLNPYFSLYSDEGSYFLTVGESAGNRAKVVNQPGDGKLSLLLFHKEVVTRVFKSQYSLSTARYPRAEFFNSYFELAASDTDTSRASNTLRTYQFKLPDFVNVPEKTSIKLLVHGRSRNARKIEVYVGKTATSLRLVKSLANSGFEGTELTFNLDPEDLDNAQNGVMALKSVSSDPEDLFSLTYYDIEFPQLFGMQRQASKEFRLEPVSEKWSRISVSDLAGKPTFLDITDTYNPVVLEGNADNLMVPRLAGKKQILLATSQVVKVDSSRIRGVTFQLFNPKATNYLIITSDSLIDGVTRYANYRASAAGGGFKPLITNIKDIYNQFNYGEPSPVAIRKFMTYMLETGGKEKYLLLIGKTVTYHEKMRRELPDEVPTIGFPASDALLVAGIAGASMDEAAIPVGRLSAVTNQNVLDYLQKVKDYESNLAQDYGWRKKFLHVNGGKTLEEITQYRDMLGALTPSVSNGIVGGTVKPFSKKQAMPEVESVDITSDVNDGVGLITFFGHGSTIVTDPDIGYISDPARGYHNLHRYPMMYFNGCGVGNIFSGRFNPKPQNPNAGDRIALSMDWLLTPDKGAIAIIANSFESFVSPASTYLEKLYGYMFMNPATTNLPIGKIQLAVAHDIISNDGDKYSIANAHQSLLQGDPALRLVTVEKPDYSVDPDAGISLSSQSPGLSFMASDSVHINVQLSNKGRYVKGQDVQLLVTFFGKKGSAIRDTALTSFPSQMNWQVSFANAKDIQKITVEIDPGQKISELDENNNVAEMEVNWDEIKDKSSYSLGNIKDNIAPLLDVKFNGRLLKNDEVIGVDPTIDIALTDDRQLFPDTMLIDIFIKPCKNDDCDFQKIQYNGGRFEVSADGSKAIRVNYQSDLGKGVYEMLVNAHDRAGNATAKPYRIRFEILEQENADIQLVASPNPASTYIRFEIKSGKQLDLKTVKYLIYNLNGDVVEEKIIPGATLSLRKEWYWLPSKVPSGLYMYKVILIDSQNITFETISGKVLIVR